MAIKQQDSYQTTSRAKEEITIDLEGILNQNQKDKQEANNRRKAEEKQRSNELEPKDKRLSYELRVARAIGALEKGSLKEKFHTMLYSINPNTLQKTMLGEKRKEERIYEDAATSLNELEKDIAGRVPYKTALSETEFNENLSRVREKDKGLEYKFAESKDKMRFTAEKFKRATRQVENLQEKIAEIELFIDEHKGEKDPTTVAMVQEYQQKKSEAEFVLVDLQQTYQDFSEQLVRDEGTMLAAENTYLSAIKDRRAYNKQLNDSNGYLVFLDTIINGQGKTSGRIVREEKFRKLRPQQTKMEALIEASNEGDIIDGDYQGSGAPSFGPIKELNSRLKEDYGTVSLSDNQEAKKILEKYNL
jgi:hypothetical protein